eukprot:GHVL01005693.1.p2 GENE.GHVL01005693.1~~GHVL01005693.1.p2  ORF type:complete len:327 (+),score=71.84 GHVL01005693.1:438-1418(+)
MGGGKGGSDFDPKGKSDSEIMRFCQSFMTSLSKHIGPNQDVPAGDIGVGGREIGYLFGQYKRLQLQFEGVLTGKHPRWGGSLMRPEATGYGAVYFANEMAKHNGLSIKGARCLISGSGNVAQYCIEKLLDEGAIALTASDSTGYIYEPDGFDHEKLKMLMMLKNVTRGRICEFTKMSKTAKFFATRPWDVENIVCAFPCATQNEIDEEDAKNLVKNGCKLVVEGSNMPTTPEAFEIFAKNKILFGPAKAANAGGVAVSGLEMAQNSQRVSWTSEEVDEKLRKIMKDVFTQCKDGAEKYGLGNDYRSGANIAGFLKVADSVIEQGCV